MVLLSTEKLRAVLRRTLVSTEAPLARLGLNGNDDLVPLRIMSWSDMFSNALFDRLYATKFAYHRFAQRGRDLTLLTSVRTTRGPE
jgi:hypothetical protein